MENNFKPKYGGILNKRKLEWFCAASLPEWGYKDEQADTFALIYPENYDENMRYPLYVVFHSAGHDVYSAVGCCWQKGNHDLYHTPKDMFGLYLDCRHNEKNDWWWGGNAACEVWGEGRDSTEPQPVERRCIATVQWVIKNYPINRERVYAVGISMGGSGAMGIAMCRGDIFASVCVDVPAGVRHVSARCGFTKEASADFSIPDPPLLFNYSAQNDSWSEGHAFLYRKMREKKYSIIGYFGSFGHENSIAKIREINDMVLTFDPFAIKRNEVYPVFTYADCDDELPWAESGEILHSKAGQINAHFRWGEGKTFKTGASVAIWLSKDSKHSNHISFCKKATANVTLRRLGDSRFAPGEQVEWNYGELCGTAYADRDGLVTIEKLQISLEKKTLVLERVFK